MMTGDPRIGLALGGGAARGIAHIEMLHALDDLGIRPARLAGTSMGALIGVAFAAGMSAQEIEEHTRQVLSNKLDAARLAFSSDKGGLLDLVNFNPFNAPLIDGPQLVRLVLPPAVPDDLSKLAIPFTVVAADFYAMKETVVTSGDPVTAVASSIAIPGAISAPAGPKTLIDGACVNPVPISHVQESCDLIVAINVTGRPVKRKHGKTRPTDLMAGAMQIQQNTISALHRERMTCDIWIEPAVDAFRLHDFFEVDAILDAAKPARDRLKRALEEAMNFRVKSDS